MFSRIRRNLTYANVTVTLALLFAMSGGAYAAGKYVITSTKEINPKVLKALKGASGKDGVNGTNGTNGPSGKDGAQGPQGPQGVPGEKGAEGKEGKEGKEGLPGKVGKEGKQGEPWTVGGTLPSEATETGVFTGTTAAPTLKVAIASVSFPIALKELQKNIEFVSQEQVEKNEVPASCAGGSFENPKAKPGWLCVFGEGLTKILQPLAKSNAGIALELEAPTEGAFFRAAWAVTAE